MVIDLAAAQDPNAGGVAGVAAAAPAAEPWSGPTGPFRYSLAEPITHHSACPGQYIMGQVLNYAGAPTAGVRIALVDQWGNRAAAISKDGALDYGNYDFPLNFFANQYTLTVVDEAGNPLSAPVVVDHLQGAGGDAPCHRVVWRGE